MTLICHLAPPDGKNFHLSCKIYHNISSVDPYRSSFNIHANDFVDSFDCGSFLTNMDPVPFSFVRLIFTHVEYFDQKNTFPQNLKPGSYIDCID